MCLPGNSVLSSTKEDHQNHLLLVVYGAGPLWNIIVSLSPTSRLLFRLFIDIVTFIIWGIVIMWQAPMSTTNQPNKTHFFYSIELNWAVAREDIHTQRQAITVSQKLSY